LILDLGGSNQTQKGSAVPGTHTCRGFPYGQPVTVGHEGARGPKTQTKKRKLAEGKCGGS